jgi:hypothetical protein
VRSFVVLYKSSPGEKYRAREPDDELGDGQGDGLDTTFRVGGVEDACCESETLAAVLLAIEMLVRQGSYQVLPDVQLVMLV